jgi:carbamoyl-phosphate synthase large subunit
VTGAGGPAAVSVLKSLLADPSVTLLAADTDPWAAGLYLVEPAARTLIPAGPDAGFADALMRRCTAMGVDVVIPTVDAELGPIAAARDWFTEAGAELLIAPERALGLTLDRLVLAQCCADVVRVPRTESLGGTDPTSWAFPVIVRLRSGSGSCDVSLVRSEGELAGLAGAEDFIVQEFLPGPEYSIDVLADRRGQVIAAVPRVREKVDQGVCMAGRTIHDRELEQLGATVVRRLGLTYIASVRCRRDGAGRPALVGVSPRPPAGLPLTVASGVDMPRLALDSLRRRKIPGQVDFREVAMVRFLDERFLDFTEVRRLAA